MTYAMANYLIQKIPFEGGLVTVNKGQAVTDSITVSRVFGKRHDHTLESIRRLILASPKLGGLYESITYKDEQSKFRPAYLMNRDGFTLLAMGFTGRKALDFKIAYIAAFNEMERRLRDKDSAEGLASAERLLNRRIDAFNAKLASAVAKARHGGRSNYGSCGDLRIGITRPYGRDFAEKLDNAFRQLEIAYLDGFSFAERMRNFEDAAEAVRRALRPRCDGVLPF